MLRRGKGVRRVYGISRGRDVAGRLYNRHVIDDTPRPFSPPMQCGGRGCEAPVVPVKGHHRSPHETWVEPMYRLASGAQHAPRCPFDVERRLQEIVKQNRAVVTEQGGVFRLRLEHTPSADLRRQLGQNRELERPGRPRRPAGIRSDPSRTLPPVLAAAREVARLIEDNDQDADLRSAFTVIHPDGNLTWDEFCWPASRVKELADDLAAHPHRPRAVYGPVLTVPARVLEKDGQPSSAIIQFNTAPAHDAVRLRVRTRELGLAKRHTARPGTFVLALGAGWAPFPPPPRTPTEIRMWVEHPWELTSWTPTAQ